VVDAVTIPECAWALLDKVTAVWRRRGWSPDDVEDFRSECVLRILLAVPKYDSCRGTMEQFLHTVIRRQATCLMREALWLRRHELTGGVYECIDQYRRIGGQCHLANEIDLRMFIDALPSKRRQVLRMILGGHSRKEAARVSAVNRLTIRRWMREIGQLYTNTRGDT
jgi:DNA-directed RNA polymerase specialized sigma24 family protein